MILWLCRHGNTFPQGSTPVWIGSQQDLPLTAEGEAQAQRLGQFFCASSVQSEVQPDLILSASLRRTRRTAEIIHEHCGGVKLKVDERLNEIDYGLWSGLTREQIVEKFGVLELQQWEQQGVWPKAAGWAGSSQRIQEQVLQLVQELGTAQKVVVVSSQGILRYFLALLPQRDGKRLTQEMPEPERQASAVVVGAGVGLAELQSLKMQTGHHGKLVRKLVRKLARLPKEPKEPKEYQWQLEYWNQPPPTAPSTSQSEDESSLSSVVRSAVRPLARLLGRQPLPLQGRIRVPGDKSVSHRALILGALAQGTSTLHGLSTSQDVQATLTCLRALGVRVQEAGEQVLQVEGGALGQQGEGRICLDCQNSGTTARLLPGLLAKQPLTVEITGDASLRVRPMRRVTEPLGLMGVRFQGQELGEPVESRAGQWLSPLAPPRRETLPLWMTGTLALQGMEYALPVASAQVKSALLLAGLQAQGTTILRGLIDSRDHTERLLRYFGAQIFIDPSKSLRLPGGQKLQPRTLAIPGDFSSAAVWLVAASVIPGSRVILEHVGLNPSRTGLLAVLARMGAKVEARVSQPDALSVQSGLEPEGTLEVSYSGQLVATDIPAQEIPRLIDELPLIAVLASQAVGVTRVYGAQELRKKECDRIEALRVSFECLGMGMEVSPDGFSIEGPQNPQAWGKVSSFSDHRMVMVLTLLGLLTTGRRSLGGAEAAALGCEVEGAECVAVSYPHFFATLKALQGGAGVAVEERVRST